MLPSARTAAQPNQGNPQSSIWTNFDISMLKNAGSDSTSYRHTLIMNCSTRKLNWRMTNLRLNTGNQRLDAMFWGHPPLWGIDRVYPMYMDRVQDRQDSDTEKWNHISEI